MIEQIVNNIYKIEIPLSDTPLRSANIYLVKGDQRNLLIDTGFCEQECLDAIHNAMDQLKFSMDNTDIFVTHVHSDHCGLAGTLQSEHTKIYCSEYTSFALTEGNHDKLWGYFDEMMLQSGLTCINLEDHPGYAYGSEMARDVILVHDHDVIRVGEFEFTCLETPGHAPQHMCLFERNQKILFAGDLILGKITPNNTIWNTPWQIKEDALGDYFDSLNKIYKLDIELTLTGHRELVLDCKKRIRELQEHHKDRLNEIVKILVNGRQSGAQVASQMNWRIRANSWDEFPNPQKIFATGEALSHLIHLQFNNIVESELCNGVVYYKLKPNWM